MAPCWSWNHLRPRQPGVHPSTLRLWALACRRMPTTLLSRPPKGLHAQYGQRFEMPKSRPTASDTSMPMARVRRATIALKRLPSGAVFGSHADRLAVSSTKSMHGHGLGAAGAPEAAATALALRNGILPPTANFTEPDPECDLDIIPNQARSSKAEYALSNSFAFGGVNAVLLFRRFDGQQCCTKSKG